MKKTLLATAIAALAMQANAGTVTSDGADIVIKTKGGFEAKTVDGDYSFKVGGRLQLDYNDYDGVINSVQGEDGSDIFFRRARIEVKGHVKDWGYTFSYNLTDSGSIDQLHTTYTGWGKLAQVTFGQQKEDFGLEDTGSSNWITAMERSLPSNAFDTGNTVGVKLHGANDLFTYSLGAFKNGIDSDNDLDSAVTGRVVFRPFMSNGNLVHIGVGATDRSGSSADYNSRLGVRGGENGTASRVRARMAGLEGDRQDYNVELAANIGPVHVMAEYFDGEIDVDDPANTTIDAKGYYAQIGWILTGEQRSYSTSSASFGGVKPSGKGGAWEVFARVDELDLDNMLPVAVTGEQAESITVGVNWYVNPSIKASVNYVRAETDLPINGEDDGDAIVARLQVAF